MANYKYKQMFRMTKGTLQGTLQGLLFACKITNNTKKQKLITTVLRSRLFREQSIQNTEINR